MGFKKIDLDELKSKISLNFLGIPIRESGKLTQKSQREKKIETSYTGSMSEVLILNEEFMEFHYQNNGIRQEVTGNGNISIFNNSVKDRIWDANLQFSGSQFDNQEKNNNINLGIFEPSSNKVLKYEIVNSDDLPDLIKINENIDNLSKEIQIIKETHEISENEESKYNIKQYLLLLGKENKIKFLIDIVNVSNFILENIKFKKTFIDNFYDLEFNCSKSKDFRVKKNSIECNLNELNPGEKAEITILANIFPKKKENINTGKIELTFNLPSKVISGVKVNHFSAYSHAMHAIEKSEKNDTPNHWECSLIFENHSDFNLKLNSIMIYDKTKSEKILDLDLKSSNTKINPRGKYNTEYFEFIDEREPTFSRKVEYSVEYRTESNSMITARFDDTVFKAVNMVIKKTLPQKEIKSFEETTLDSKIVINNQSTVPIKGVRIVEKVPEDFLPPSNISDVTLFKSSGKITFEDIKLKVIPDDDDPSHEHTIELLINLENNSSKAIIEVEDFLELKYPLKAISPDHNKDYDFPLKVYAYYPKYENTNAEEEYYVIMDDLSLDKSSLNISHKRRKVMVGKQIFPGRSSDEFAIYIIAKNGSNIKLTDVNITDTFPNSFKLISSNLEHKISVTKKNGEQNISFTIDTLLPYQEKEIMYYLKTLDGKDVKHSELESYFIG